MTAKELRLILVVTALFFISAAFFADLGKMPLSDRDEGEYAASTAEMLRRNDMVVPMLNGKLYFEKPGMIFQAIATSWKITGKNELGARLPSAISALIILAAVWFAAIKTALFDKKSFLFPMAILAFSPLFLLTGRACLTDMPLTCCTTLSLIAFFFAFEGAVKNPRLFYLISWFFMGAGFMVKGLVALAVILLPAAIYSLIRGRLWKTVFIDSSPVTGILCFLIVSMPWYGTMLLKYGRRFWEPLFVDQHFGRFTEVTLGHGGGIFYYLPVFLLLCFPFSAAFFSALAEMFPKTVQFIKKKGNNSSLLEKLSLFSLLTALSVFVVFSAAATKQINYIMPAIPFAAIISAAWWKNLDFKQNENLPKYSRLFMVLTTIAASVWIILFSLFSFKLQFLWKIVLNSIRFDSSEYALPAIQPTFPLLSLTGIILILSVLLSVLFVFLKKDRSHIFKWIAVTLSACFCYFTIAVFLPNLAKHVQEPAKTLCLDIKNLDKTLQAVSYGLWKPSMMYYMDSHIERFRVNDDQQLDIFAKTEKPVFIFTRTRLIDKIDAMENIFILKSLGGYLLCGNSSAATIWNNKNKKFSPKTVKGENLGSAKF